MMYSVAALAMILPLVDLHCGKSESCKIQDFKTQNEAFKTQNTEFKTQNEAFKTEVQKLVAGGLATDADMILLKDELLGAAGSTAPKTIYDHIVGSSHADSINSKIEAIKTDGAKETTLTTISSAVAKETTLTTIQSAVNGLATSNALATAQKAITDSISKKHKKILREVTEIKNAMLNTAPRYLKVEVTLSNGDNPGDSYLVAKKSETCQNIYKADKDNYVMCCKSGVFDKASSVEVDHWKVPTEYEQSFFTARNVCRSISDEHSLCDEASVKKIMAIDTATKMSSGTKKMEETFFKFDENKALQARADSTGAVKVWTGIEC